MVSPSYNLYWIKQRSLASPRIILVTSRTANNFPFPFNQRSCNICFVVSCNDLAQLVKNTYIVSWIKNWSIEECILFIYLFISRELIGSLRSLVLRHDSLKKSLKKDAAKFNISWLFLIIQLLQLRLLDTRLSLTCKKIIEHRGLARKEVEFNSAHSVSSLCRKYKTEIN